MKEKGSARYQNYILLYSGVEKNNRAVASIGVHQKFENIMDEIEYLNKNIIRITIKRNTGKMLFISIYALDISKLKEEREIFFEELQETIDKLTNNEKIFIMGDFNSRIGNILFLTLCNNLMRILNDTVIY